MNNAYLEEAVEAIRTNGKCPNNQLCDTCWFKVINGTVAGCNPSEAVSLAKVYLTKMGHPLV